MAKTTCQRTERVLRVEYSAPVRECERRLRVFPAATRGGQRVLELQWHCEPTPVFTEESADECGNRVLALRHNAIARVFEFTMTLVTEQTSTPLPREANLPPTGIGAFLVPSALCDLTGQIQELACEMKARCQAPRQLIAEVCEFAQQSVEYSPGATQLQTPASRALQFQKGVCQDHAHLMIALCRALKIPARYVAGYLPGEGAMHAWAEVLLENEWRGYDPTHNREARRDYVFVASGRDARDCAPHEGSFHGRARARLYSWCKTTVC